MGAPFDTGTWNGVADTYYTGSGSTEWLWLIVMIAMLILPLVFGHNHESDAYKKAEK
ncbi:MAG: hypothetical protein AAGA53_13610 [Pseudomonadota bacterium]